MFFLYEADWESTDEVDVVVAKIFPQANAGPNQTVNESVIVTLNASNSIFVRLAYQWLQTAGTAATLTGAATATTTLTAPKVRSNGKIYIFRLTITDDNSSEDTETVNITVRNPKSFDGGGEGGGGCFISTATINLPMTLSGYAPQEPNSKTTMVI